MRERKARVELTDRRPDSDSNLSCLVECHRCIEMKMPFGCSHDKRFTRMESIIRSRVSDVQNGVPRIDCPPQREALVAGPGETIRRMFFVPTVPRHIPCVFHLEDAG